MNTPTCPRGFSLIEVLVAILVLAIGMLGVAALQATALRNSQSSYERTQAVVESYSIIDSMRANRSAAVIGEYDMAWTCDLPDAEDLPSTEQRNWIQSLQSNLGTTACGRIECDGTSCLVAVRWDDSRGTGGGSGYTVETETVL